MWRRGSWPDGMEMGRRAMRAVNSVALAAARLCLPSENAIGGAVLGTGSDAAVVRAAVVGAATRGDCGCCCIAPVAGVALWTGRAVSVVAGGAGLSLLPTSIAVEF